MQEVAVGPALAECYGRLPRTCLVVDGLLFYQEIDGLEYEPGCHYRRRIERYDTRPDRDEPPADASRYGYRLLELL